MVSNLGPNPVQCRLSLSFSGQYSYFELHNGPTGSLGIGLYVTAELGDKPLQNIEL